MKIFLGAFIIGVLLASVSCVYDPYYYHDDGYYRSRPYYRDYGGPYYPYDIHPPSGYTP